MVYLKTESEIEIMRGGGAKLSKITPQLVAAAKPGITTESIDKLAEKLILAEGGEPSFKRVTGYRWSTCLPINEQVVHTPPSKRVLQDGDVLTIDVGMYYKGFHTDWATTVLVGESSDTEKQEFLAVGREALQKGIDQAKVGNRVGHISQAIQAEIYGAGYKVLRELTGHGVGKDLHEDPFIPNYLDRAVEKTPRLRPGMTLAIEVIYSRSSEKIEYEKGEEWSIITRDRSLSACFEKTIAITDKNSFILT